MKQKENKMETGNGLSRLESNDNFGRRFFCKAIAAGSFSWILGKAMVKRAHAAVDGKYANIMPNVKTS